MHLTSVWVSLDRRVLNCVCVCVCVHPDDRERGHEADPGEREAGQTQPAGGRGRLGAELLWDPTGNSKGVQVNPRVGQSCSVPQVILSYRYKKSNAQGNKFRESNG